MGYYAMYNGNSLTTFPGHLPTTEDVTDRLTRNVGK
jgi:hypothetical protein